MIGMLVAVMVLALGLAVWLPYGDYPWSASFWTCLGIFLVSILFVTMHKKLSLYWHGLFKRSTTVTQKRSTTVTLLRGW